MTLQNNKSWLLGIFASVMLITGGSYFYSDANAADASMIQFADLSNADIDLILSVKAKMNAAAIQPD